MGPRKNSGANGAPEPGEGGSGGQGQDNDYLSRRARNNEAVKRSREKARHKAKETHERVTKLKNENENLEEKIKLLSKELTFLKDIFLAHAGNSHGLSMDDLDLKSLLKEEADDGEGSRMGAGEAGGEGQIDFMSNASNDGQSSNGFA